MGGATGAPALHRIQAVVEFDIGKGVPAVFEDGAKVVLFRAVLKFAVRPQNATQVGVNHDGGVGCIRLYRPRCGIEASCSTGATRTLVQAAKGRVRCLGIRIPRHGGGKRKRSASDP